VPALFDGEHIAADMALIRREWGQRDRDRIDVFLNELGSREDAMWALAQRRQDRNFDRPFFNSCAIEWMLEDGYNMYRMRPTVAAPAYRMLYAFDAEVDEFHVLAIVRKLPRSSPDYDRRIHYDYERDHHISVRVLAEYDQIGIPLV
jgi:hypothetical protein